MGSAGSPARGAAEGEEGGPGSPGSPAGGGCASGTGVGAPTGVAGSPGRAAGSGTGAGPSRATGSSEEDQLGGLAGAPRKAKKAAREVQLASTVMKQVREPPLQQGNSREWPAVFQFALQARAGTDCLASMLRVAVELN